MYKSVELELARREIQSYDEEALIQESNQAQECMDCEAFLGRGIAALEWLERGENTLCKGHAAGLYDITQETEEGIDILYEAWLRPCAFAETWIAKCEENGYDIGNLAQFRDCCSRAQERVERAERFKLSKAIRDEKLSQEPW